MIKVLHSLQKISEHFFELLKENGVKKVVDKRIIVGLSK